MTKKIKTVLFVCTANRYRSPFSEAVFRAQLQKDGQADEWHVGSAGTWTKAGKPVLPHVAQKAQEIGLNLDDHRSAEVNLELLLAYTLIIVMESGHKEALSVEFTEVRERIFLLSEVIDDIAYDIPDPAKSMDDADEIVAELYDLLQRGHTAICELIEKMS